MIITKTIFLDFLYCPKNIWLKLHRHDLTKHFTISEYEKHLMEQGNEVESYARNLFENAIEIVGTGEEACQETVRLMTAKIPTLFQSTFIVDGFMARNDVLSYDKENDCWNMYEVKGTNSIKENTPEHDHIDDLTFQASVLKRANIKIGKYFLIHLNKEYTRAGDINVKEIFIIEDMTDKVLEYMEELEGGMEIAKDYLLRETEPVGKCECVYQGRSRHCSTFQYSNPEIPTYSVHDISRIGSSKKKLESLIEGKIYNIADVPEDLALSDIQKNQIDVHVSQRSIINIAGIKEEIDKLVFPFYFLDYETFAPAIPLFDGYRPYQRIPFQFSLHILRGPEDKMTHVQYLHKEMTDPTPKVAELLSDYMVAPGTVITWNKSFERGVNEEIGGRLPSYENSMAIINSMLYDLMDPFKKQYYVHPDFRGSNSIKKVLPAIAPELNYKDLGIQGGAEASDSWWKMVSPATPKDESDVIKNDLEKYCERDTYAMYVIWKHLYDTIK